MPGPKITLLRRRLTTISKFLRWYIFAALILTQSGYFIVTYLILFNPNQILDSALEKLSPRVILITHPIRRNNASSQVPETALCYNESREAVFEKTELDAACGRAIYLPGQHPGDPNLDYLMVRPLGRLGNQLFILSSILGMAYDQNRAVCLPAKLKDLYGLDLSCHRIAWMQNETWLHIKERSFASFDSCFKKLPQRNIAPMRFLQSYKYFEHSWTKVKKHLRFKKSIQTVAWEVLNRLYDRDSHPRNATAIVGVHVRRTDMLEERHVTLGHTTANETYFLKSFQWMIKAIPEKKVVFLVVTDDIDWCTRHLKTKDVKIAPEAMAVVHLALLASCDHVIMSTGTFGWWGAWLAGGKVVYYTNYPAEHSTLADGFNRSDFFHPSWVGLE